MELSERDIERIAARVAKKIARNIARELAYAQQPFLDLKGAAEFLGYMYMPSWEFPTFWSRWAKRVFVILVSILMTSRNGCGNIALA